jgi:predicted dehydrogenase
VWTAAHAAIAAGRIGHVSHAQAGSFRNDIRGQWRYYRLAEQMTPKTVDWNLFLGHRFDVNGERLAPEMPFDRAAFAQWRCEAEFSGGPFTDLLSHPLTRLLAATGLRYPYRVTAGGGLFLEQDGRSVPDVGTIVADFSEGAQLQLTAATTTNYPMEEVIRGRNGAIKFVKNGFQVIRDDPHGKAGLPPRIEREIPFAEMVRVDVPVNETEALWQNFLGCVRTRNPHTLSGPDLGMATMATLAMARKSHEDGRAYGWDMEHRTMVPADAAWIAKQSPRPKPGATVPPDYMGLRGS